MSFESAATKSSATPTDRVEWDLENSYGTLSGEFHSAVLPTPVREPGLAVLNRPLAASLGLDPDALAENAVRIFAGNEFPAGATPLAQAYAGHQYGNFTMLGDGRAILLGERIAPDGRRFDIQLKGPGRTPYSRGGDGRATLGPMLREYIISEAMHALGIPTTRSLAVATTGETVMRQDGPLPGAVLTRVAASHIRVGTFQFAAALGGNEMLREITGYTLRRHFPERAEAESPALALLEGVVGRQASLLAKWMGVGFIHGVMNTDNVALSGETIDYGPCAFMDAYDPATVFSSIDRRGRYAYANQPSITQWNLARFAEALLPLLHDDEQTAIEIALGAIHGFTDQYQANWLAGLRRKLGLFNEEPEDLSLIHTLLAWMNETNRDFTNTFASLGNATAENDAAADEGFVRWQEEWRARLSRQSAGEDESRALRQANNPFVIPRNHLVEAALSAAVDGDLKVMENLVGVLAHPYDHDRPVDAIYREAGVTGDDRYVTYCGT